MPRSVRYALWLLTLTLIGSSAFMAGPVNAPVPAALAVIIVGCLLVANARRRNWARLTLAAVYVLGLPFNLAFYVLGLPFNLVLLPIRFRQAPLFTLVSIAQIVLMGAGIALLFRAVATSWYRGRPAGSGLTSA